MGFHHEIAETIMDDLGWVQDGLVELSVDVEHIPEQIGRPSPFMIYYDMIHMDVQNIHEVIKIWDTLVDMLEGYKTGCYGTIGVVSRPRPVTVYAKYWHTNVIPSATDLPKLIENDYRRFATKIFCWLCVMFSQQAMFFFFSLFFQEVSHAI